MRRCFPSAIGIALIIGSLCLAGVSCGNREQGGTEGTDRGSLPLLRLGRVIEVTDGTEEYMIPIWSPDGRKLAFTEPGFERTYVKNADGTGPIRDVRSSKGSPASVRWTSDSKALLRRRPGGGRAEVINVETGEIRVEESGTSLEGSLRRKIHGHTVYYTDDRPSPPDVDLDIDYREKRVWVIEGGDIKRTEFPHRVLLATLSPRRDLVVFLPGDGNMYVSRLDGSAMVNLGRGCRWDWSQDGRRLVYLGATQQDHYTVIAAEIFVINADGSGSTQITDTPDVVEDYPTWSPDGMRIAYSTVNTGQICVAVLEEIE